MAQEEQQDPRQDFEAAQDTAWHSLDMKTALERLQSSADGLDSEEAKRRLETHGPNRLRPPEKDGPLKRFLLQFHNVLIYILIVAAIGTAFLQHWVDTGVILAVVLINAIIGFIQEGKAEKALDAIRGMLSPKAMVLRDGHRQTVDAEELVPGDIVLLQAGDRVPADLRLVEARNLRIDEAVLTGESVAVDKGLDPVDEASELGDRSSLAFSGTLVAFGRGLGVVAETGEQTEIGRVSTMLSEVESTTTPLLRQVAQFGHWLSVAIVAVAVATFLFGYLVRDYAAMDMFLAAVSLAVAAIPEGLPAIMTITLAIGVQRMARRNAIIRRLPAVETLGSVTVICSDKTGTLTRNEMTVQEVVTADRQYQVTGVGYEPHGDFELDGRDVEPDDSQPVLCEILQAVMLCNEAQVYEKDGRWRMEGDPTEGALITAALKAGMDARQLAGRMPRTDVIPFESSYKFMVTLHHDHEGNGYIIMKGAPERVLAVCAEQRTADGDQPLDPDWWQARMDEVAERGQRLLAVATKRVPADKRDLTFDDVEDGLVLLGVMGIIDPAREEAIAAVGECHSAGIQVRMITGDHSLTARAIGKQLGIGDGEHALAGHEIQEMDDTTLQERARDVEVFARTTPEHKLRLVKVLQADNQVVAMTGDGVNDAPALKRADVGIAMGVKGTEAAKEASEMVLADDNFASIAHAVEEGRTVYDNLKKAILFILPTNGGQAFTIVSAIMLGLALPLEPVQALWVNMVTAVTLALALAFEPPEPGLMERRPREPGRPLLSGFLIWRVLFVSALLVVGTFGHYFWMIEWEGASQELARTAAINTLVVGQMFYLINSRYILESVLNIRGLLGSRPVLIAIALLLVLQMLFTYSGPFQFLFSTEGIGWDEWSRILIFGLALFFIVEAEKAVLRPRLDPTRA
ncbi:cation-transporting P-type ATPase [Alkalilimnicola ehrlichii MLHE-1]|uniref:ATPase, P-type (Transporting), HAD superfamily, subfamily IC n=1 Tax=Alkalilimnicola ehrlichii (strain ATCC BAA-1101 / DSM 17681 / MLHE-1) TaxID=187272 RepID=Q0A9V9_ALKEH|nr:cation-transporting P-type ATPase [Alkalilimnicola ehrlichii]ABI56378.1 ATPase, P-type (transporting), HAD superfamily, subfamily IC [Alkalilimnicola ehrlichii MLHE-1]